MKTMKTNGQVLSEKEMRDVKGGTIVIPKEGYTPGKCSVCGSTTYIFDSGIYICACCGKRMTEEEFENELEKNNE